MPMLVTTKGNIIANPSGKPQGPITSPVPPGPAATVNVETPTAAPAPATPKHSRGSIEWCIDMAGEMLEQAEREAEPEGSESSRTPKEEPQAVVADAGPPETLENPVLVTAPKVGQVAVSSLKASGVAPAKPAAAAVGKVSLRGLLRKAVLG